MSLTPDRFVNGRLTDVLALHCAAENLPSRAPLLSRDSAGQWTRISINAPKTAGCARSRGIRVASGVLMVERERLLLLIREGRIARERLELILRRIPQRQGNDGITRAGICWHLPRQPSRTRSTRH